MLVLVTAEFCDDAVLASHVRIGTGSGLQPTSTIGNGFRGGTNDNTFVNSIVVDMGQTRSIAYLHMYLHDVQNGECA